VEKGRTSATTTFVSEVPNAFWISAAFAISPLDTFTNTFAIWRTSSTSFSTPFRHSWTLFL
jgi:hypothetical protein